MFTVSVENDKASLETERQERSLSSISVWHMCLHSWLPYRQEEWSPPVIVTWSQQSINSQSPRVQTTLLGPGSRIQQVQPHEMYTF